MTNIALTDVEAVVKPYGFQVERASINQGSIFEHDLDDADKYDLGRTWRQDWKAELYATLEKSTSTFLVSSNDHAGAAIFGVTSARDGAAQVWLLQSKMFAINATQQRGAAWPRQFVSMTSAMTQVFLNTYTPIFNFISSRQEANIRWLKLCGFEFFQLVDVKTDMYLFGQGNNLDQLASDTRLWRAYLGKGISHA